MPTITARWSLSSSTFPSPGASAAAAQHGAASPIDFASLPVSRFCSRRRACVANGRSAVAAYDVLSSSRAPLAGRHPGYRDGAETRRGDHRRAACGTIDDFVRSASERNRKFVDSPLEGDGFELPVPRVMQARLKAKIIAKFGMPPSIICGCRRWPSAQAQSEKSRNQTQIARGTGSSNPSASSGESVANSILAKAALPMRAGSSHQSLSDQRLRACECRSAS